MGEERVTVVRLWENPGARPVPVGGDFDTEEEALAAWYRTLKPGDELWAIVGKHAFEWTPWAVRSRVLKVEPYLIDKTPHVHVAHLEQHQKCDCGVLDGPTPYGGHMYRPGAPTNNGVRWRLWKTEQDCREAVAKFHGGKSDDWKKTSAEKTIQVSADGRVRTETKREVFELLPEFDANVERTSEPAMERFASRMEERKHREAQEAAEAMSDTAVYTEAPEPKEVVVPAGAVDPRDLVEAPPLWFTLTSGREMLEQPTVKRLIAGKEDAIYREIAVQALADGVSPYEHSRRYQDVHPTGLWEIHELIDIWSFQAVSTAERSWSEWWLRKFGDSDEAEAAREKVRAEVDAEAAEIIRRHVSHGP